MPRALPRALIASLGVGTLAKHIAVPERTPHLNLKIEQTIALERLNHTTADGIRLSYLFVPSAKRDFVYDVKRTETNGLRFDMRVKNAQASVPTRGSIIYLHGWGSNGDQFTPWALALAEQGFSGVNVDLRGHGDSADAPAGYGPREAADITDLVRGLLAQGRIQPPIYLMGTSYGGSTALFAEPALRDVIAGIVAFAPFQSANEGIRGAIREAQDTHASGIRARITLAALGRMNDSDIDAAIDEASEQLSISLRNVDARPIVAASQTCILLLHGADDRMFPAASSHELAASTPMASATTVNGHGHVDLPMRLDWLVAPVATWVAATSQRTNDNACPSFKLPPEPTH